MISLQTNVNSLVAQQNLSANSAFQSKTIQQLTSGYRINSSGDDAAGLAVANKFRDATAELTQGVANGNDATAQLQIMDGGMTNIGQMLDRLKTLAMQSASGAFSGGDAGRITLNNEFQNTITEIDRQAQSIGLNTGGTFAKSLSIYLGAGSGSQSAANSVVTVDLSKSTVDSNSLGLTSNQAVNTAAYDLSASSKTSVAKIISDASNQADATTNASSAETAVFVFSGQGFAGATNAVTVKADLSGVTDTTSLVTALNNAITNQGNNTSSGATQNAAFKAAGITASIVTDSSGNQKLAFSSANAFSATSGDILANALMGNFNVGGQTVSGKTSTAATGQSVDYTAAGTQDLGAGLDLSTVANNIVLTFTNGGTTSTGSNTVTLAKNYATAAAVAADIQSQINVNADLKNAGLTASIVNNKLLISSREGAVTIKETDGAAGSLKLPGYATSAATATTTTSMYATFNASGASQLGTTSGSATNATDLDFTSLGTVAATQNITITGNDTNGKSHSTTVSLASSNTAAANAVDNLNIALQATGDATLQKITAIVSNDSGSAKINFVSNLKSFSVEAANATTAGEGISAVSTTGAADSQNVKVSSVQVGSGGSVEISSQAGGQVAVTAITAAVAALGTAQAAIGKGQNALGYAINLANSQITNNSAAESQIRDTNVAQQAANLSKAQLLSQAAIAAMAQANSAPQAILSLLRG